MSAAVWSFMVLTVVATSKIFITKAVLTHLTLPVFYSFLSAVVTAVGIVPTFFCRRSTLTYLDAKNQDGILLSSIAIALDLVFANIALSLLPISVQQCIRAIAPGITLLIESCAKCKRPKNSMMACVMGICLGPVLMEARSSALGDVWGILAMLASVTASATKNVLAHGMIRASKASMNLLSYLFWVEIFVALMILPWVFLTTHDTITFLEASVSLQLATLATAAYGGVRILTQMLFLKHTSPTSLAVSNVIVQLLSTYLGILFLGEPHDIQTFLGALVTATFTLIYMCLKKKQGTPPPSEEATQMMSSRSSV